MAPEDLDPELVAFLSRAMADYRGHKRDQRTLSKMWDDWFPSIVHRAGAVNKRSYRRFLLTPFAFDGLSLRLGDLTPAECTAPVLESWKASLALYRGDRGALAPGTRDQIRLAVQGMLTYYVNIAVLNRNPFKGIPRETGRLQQRQGYFTEKELEHYLSHCPPLLGAILRTSSRCGGLRTNEVRTLRKDAINWETKEATLKQKGGTFKSVILTDDVIDLLKHWCALAPGDYVFFNPRDPRGRAISRAGLYKMNARARKAYGARLLGEDPVPYHARHTFAVLSLEKGAPETWVAQQMGHKNTSQIGRYGKLRGRAKDTMRELANMTVAEAKKNRQG